MACMSSRHPLLHVTTENLKVIREFIGIRDDKDFNERIDAITEWLKKQDHLVEASKYFNRNYLGSIIILSKGSVEEAKNRVDKIMTYRGLMSELITNISLDEFGSFWECINYVPLPKLNTDNSRVFITQFKSNNLNDVTLLAYARFCIMMGDCRFFYDFSPTDRYIVDFKNIQQSALLSKFNPVILSKAETLFSKAYGGKINGIHFLNASQSMSTIVLILKQALGAKLASRLHVHNSYEDLYQHVSKEILPKEYGGDEVSGSKLAEQWAEFLHTEEAMKIIKGANMRVADESRRQSGTLNQEYLGTQGSFKKLVID